MRALRQTTFNGDLMKTSARTSQAALRTTRQIPDHILAVLSSMEIQGNVLLEYPQKLERKDYELLNKALEALGGKWSKKAPRGHHFLEDPSERIAAAIATGSYDCPRLAGFFQTPEWLAKQMAEEAVAVVGRDARFLEPSAGGGRLVDALWATGARRITAIELDSGRSATLGTHMLHLMYAAAEGQTNRSSCCGGDFLDFVESGIATGLHMPERAPLVADAVVMNPPFNRGLDVKHVAAAISLQSRSEPGKPWCLRAIMSAGVRFRQDMATRKLRAAIDCLGGTIEDLPEGTFREAGTDVRTVLVRIAAVS